MIMNNANNKEKYCSPELEITEYETSDILTTSAETSDNDFVWDDMWD